MRMTGAMLPVPEHTLREVPSVQLSSVLLRGSGSNARGGLRIDLPSFALVQVWLQLVVVRRDLLEGHQLPVVLCGAVDDGEDTLVAISVALDAIMRKSQLRDLGAAHRVFT